MKYFFTKTIILYFLLSNGTLSAQYSYDNTGTVYFGMGTSISSYLGGYFGNAYQMRVLSDYYDDDYYNSSSAYYPNDYYYDQSYYTLWSPLQFDVAMGYNLHQNISLEFSSSFIFHYNGRVDPEFVSGTIGNNNYLDRNSYSTLFAIPVSATLNFHSSPGDNSGVFIKGGPAFQYTSESYDRIREHYSYNNYYYNSYYSYLGTYSKKRWLPGFTVAVGASFGMSEGITNFTEIQYSYFNINGNNSTALALDRAKEAQLFSLTTKFYINF